MGVKGVTFYNFGSLDFFPGGCYGGTPPKKLNLKSTKSCLLPWFAEQWWVKVDPSSRYSIITLLKTNTRLSSITTAIFGFN